MSQNKFLIFNNVSFFYNEGAEALRHVSFTMDVNDRIALLGLNGSGKSTLLLHTDGLLLPTSGTVYVDGEPLSEKTTMKARQNIGMVFQNSDDQLFMPTVEADVAFGPRNMGLSRSEAERRVKEALDVTGTSHLRHRSPYELSGGQKRMVALATVLSMTPKILVLDEPTSGLDYEATERFVSLMKQLPGGIIMSTHDLTLAQELCSRAIVMRHGEIIYDGPLASAPYPYPEDV